MNADPAMGRWLIIQIVRLTGVAITLIGVLALAGRIEALPKEAGFAFALAGLIAALWLPLVLSRKWKTPPE